MLLGCVIMLLCCCYYVVLLVQVWWRGGEVCDAILAGEGGGDGSEEWDI